jgi:hypothetical protein
MKIKILIAAVFIIGGTVLFATNWKTIKKTDNYIVSVAKDKNSSLQKLKVVATMEGSIKKAKKVILDIENYKNFMPKVENAIIFDKKDNCIFTYTKMNAPIISNRDYVLKICIVEESEKQLKIYWDTVEDSRYPKNEKYVRLTINKGFWLIEKINENNIKITYSFSIDPKTSAPSFIINNANKKTIVKIIKAIEKEINNLK